MRWDYNWNIFFSFLLIFFISFFVTFSSDKQSSKILTVNLEEFEGLEIDSVLIDNHNIYDVNGKEYDNIIFKTANKLHYKTRKHIILKELLFKAGDSLSCELVEESERNLRNRLALFNAWIEVEKLENDHLLIKVITIDQWSMAGGLDIERDGNETEYRLWGEEKNFLGRNQFISFERYFVNDEDDYFSLFYQNNRVFGGDYSLDWSYSNNSLDNYHQVGFGRPFYSLQQSFSFEVNVLATGGRIDKYRDDLRISESDHEGDLADFYVEYRYGEYKRKIHFIGQHTYRYERVFDEKILSDSPEDIELALNSFPEDSVYNEDRIGIMLSNVDFMKTSRLEGYEYIEDVTLGQTFFAGFSRAFTPDYDGALYNTFEFQSNYLYSFNGNIISLTYKNKHWFNVGSSIRKYSSLTTRFYNNSLDFLTLAARGIYISDWFENGNNNLSLSGSGDLRGFNKNFKTGDRMALVNMEGRFYTGLEILSVMFGGVVFADLGRTWKDDESFELRDFYLSVGVGLRLHIERTSKGKVLRFDISYSEKNGWQISTGTGQFFFLNKILSY